MQFQEAEKHPRFLGQNPPAPKGQVFGHLRVESDVLCRMRSTFHVECVCLVCGETVSIDWYNLKHGKSTRCNACAKKQSVRTRTDPIWGRPTDAFDMLLCERWRQTVSRCTNPADPQWDNYGGRGIRIADEFLNRVVYVNYVRSLPDASPELTIDRTDNNRGYEPGNLRWVTQAVQASNKRGVLHVEWQGATYSASAWAKKFSRFNSTAVTRFLHAGLTPTQILERENDPNPGLRPRKRRSRAPVPDCGGPIP